MSYTAAALLAILSAALIGGVSGASGTARHAVYEAALTSAEDYANPYSDVGVSVEFTSPSGKRSTVDAFWDGGKVWRVRFSPTEAGRWRWRSECSHPADKGLHGRTGTLECVPYRGSDRLLAHGPLKLSSNRRHLVHTDGTPFFWLADTAWNGVLKAEPRDWEKYLRTRKSQGFTAVQFVSTEWRALERDARGETSFADPKYSRVNPEFFKRLDAKVAAINKHGMVASPVMLWAISPDDVGQKLSEADAIRLTRYMVARWGAHNVVWMLGGDGRYGGEGARRWHRIGRAVFGEQPSRPATMHPCGQSWFGEEFRREPWFSFIGYQSGHGDSPQSVKWLLEGPPAREWDKAPVLPVINLEPNYEAHISYNSKKAFDALGVRKALYRSLLVSPTAGVTYGHHGIWFWAEKAEIPLNHGASGIAPPWHEAVGSEGAESVKHLSKFFTSIKWWELRPAQGLLAVQPGADDPNRFVTVSQGEKGDLLVAYLPVGGTIELKTETLKHPLRARWFDPRTGKWTEIGKVASPTQRFAAPDAGDWVLCVRP